MSLHFDLESQLYAAAEYGSEQPLDWRGLRARFAASLAARAALAPDSPRATPVDGGSFDRGSAESMAQYGMGQAEFGKAEAGKDGGLDPVNPAALANGKSGCDNHAGVTSNVADD